MSLRYHAFCSIFTAELSDDLPLFNQHKFSVMDPIVIRPDDILKNIDSIKLSSSVEFDYIITKAVKYTRFISCAFITRIFSQSLNTGTVLDDWRTLKFISIF